MEFIPIFPTLIGGSVLSSFSQDKIDSWIYYIKNSELGYIANNNDDCITKNLKLLDNPLFLDLKNIIYQLSKEYIKKIGITISDIQCSTSWGYLTGKNNTEYNWHKHKNSLISGVFYLTDGSPIEFRSNRRDNFDFFFPFVNQRDYDVDHFRLYPEPNLLILFPSYLEHNVTKIVKKERISIAFNIIPKGEFGGATSKIFL